MLVRKRELQVLLILGVCVGCVSRGALNAPRRLMATKCPAHWEDIDTNATTWGGHDCSEDDPNRPLIAHESGWIPVTFRLRVTGRLSDGSPRLVSEATVWFREPFWNDVRRVTLGAQRSEMSFENSWTLEMEQHDLSRDADGFTEIEVRLKTSGYPGCKGGHVVKNLATYPQLMLVTSPGCHDAISTIDRTWQGARTIELECAAASPNKRVNAAVRPVTPLAKGASVVPGRPARYALR